MGTTERDGGGSKAKSDQTGWAKWAEDQFKNPEFQQLLTVGSIAALLFLNMSSRDPAKEVSFQQFKTQLLESGLVDHIEVTNGKTARVFVRPPGAAASGKPSACCGCVCQADKSAVATVPKTKELKKRSWGLERKFSSVLEAVSVRAAPLSARRSFIIDWSICIVPFFLSDRS